MVTVVLRVDFKPYISQDWIFEEMSRVGLFRVGTIDTYGTDGQFLLGGTLNGCFALVGTSEENKLQITRNLRLIPTVTRIEELDTKGA